MPQMAGLIPILTKVMPLVSTASGLYGSYENAQQMNKARGIVDDPRKFQQFAAGYTRPLAAGVMQGVTNAAQGQAAERGLAESPAQEQQIVAQAIAPYIQQNQQQGQQDALAALGLMVNGAGSNPNAGSQLTSGLDSLSQWYQLHQAQKNAGNQVPYVSPVPDTAPQIPYEDPNQGVDLTGWSFGS